MKRITGLLGTAFLCLGVGASSQTAATTETPVLPNTVAAPTTYRLMYTITELDGTKNLGTQHYALTVDPASKDAQIRLSSSVPMVTPPSNSQTPSGLVYADIGLSISAHIHEFKSGVEVFSDLQQTELGDDSWKQTGRAVIRHANLDNTALLTLGKPVMLGSLDIPGSTRHLDINVVAEIAR